MLKTYAKYLQTTKNKQDSIEQCEGQLNPPPHNPITLECDIDL